MAAAEARPEIEKKGIQNVIYELATGKLGTAARDVVGAQMVLNTPEFSKMVTGAAVEQQQSIFANTTYLMQGTEQGRYYFLPNCRRA